MSEYLLVGWKQIHELFKDKNGKPVISLQTLRQTYGPDMKRMGVAIEFNTGSQKRPSICAWPSKVQMYWQIRQQKKWEKEHPINELLNLVED